MKNNLCVYGSIRAGERPGSYYDQVEADTLIERLEYNAKFWRSLYDEAILEAEEWKSNYEELLHEVERHD